MKSCSVEGCGGAFYSLGYCYPHYRRFRRHGDPLGGTTSKGVVANFVRSLISGAISSDECITWPFARGTGGRAAYQANGKRVTAHRYICEAVHGEPPSNEHQAAHSCGNGHLGCVNPKHLRWATPQENMDDQPLHGRRRNGERHYASKITEADVAAIRSSTEGPKALAARYGINRNTVMRVRNRKNWAHVP